jgi:hypothetical protein
LTKLKELFKWIYLILQKKKKLQQRHLID